MKLQKIYHVSAIIVLIGLILWFGKSFLIPLAYALLTALVLYPLTRFFERKGFGRAFSILIPIVLVSLSFSGLVLILSYELAILSAKWPLIHDQFQPYLFDIQNQLELEFGWTQEMQSGWIKDNLSTLSQNTGKIISNALAATFEALFNVIIIPIYIALILNFRGRLVEFATDIVPANFREKMPIVIQETVSVFSRFIRGMVLVYLSVGILNSIGLWIIGVDAPFVYGMITAIMTIIPYFGIIISALLPMIVSWMETESIWQPIGIVAVFSVVQYLEANLIFPYVVGRFVNLNTLAAIIAIFLGALFWGVAGMILFLPFIAVFRLIADHFDELKPWSRLLGSK